MNFPENTDQSRETGDAIDASGQAALFSGDTGQLPLDTRRVLVQLLAGPSVDTKRHKNLWPVLLRDEAVITRRLSELFLELVVDRDLQVAFTRQADAGDADLPVLLRRVRLTFVDSILLLLLRQRLSQSDARGERAVIDVDEIKEDLKIYERGASTDHAGFVKRVSASIEKMKDHSILQKIRGSDDRYEISPTLKLLLSPEEIQMLGRLYQEMAAGDSAAPARGPLPEPEEEASE